MSHGVMPPRAPRLQSWSIAIWVALLWSCFVEQAYVQHLAALRQAGPLGWLGPVGNFVLIVICVAALLRIHWARPALRIGAGLVALWLPLSAWQELSLWRQLAQPPQGLQPSAVLAMQASMQQQLHWILSISLAFKLLLMLFWWWLSWRLGRPDVAPLFYRRRKSRG